MDKKIIIENFFISETKFLRYEERRIEELINKGYRPLMKLVEDKKYSVWAFIKE